MRPLCYLIYLIFFSKYQVGLSVQLPEENLTAEELITYYGYPLEVHKVETKDGYILTMQRIPNGKQNFNQKSAKKQTVLLQHGLAGSSTNWITNLPHQSLGFILADQGYDVWLGNMRGTRYSKGHTTFSDAEPRYWEFSWQEMAEYDLPAKIDYILNKTGHRQITYVGHSQGTLVGFAKFSSDLDFARKVKLFIALAPVSTVGYITTPIRYVAPLAWPIRETLNLFGDHSGGNLRWTSKYVQPACNLLILDEKAMCENILFFFTSTKSKKNLNETRIPIYLSHNPDGTSMRNIVHFAQMVNTGRMQKYDYGFFKNMKLYGQLEPPVYQPELMLVKTVVFHSAEDGLCHPRDVVPLLAKIRNLKGNFQLDDYSHLDFIWAKNANQRIYAKIVEYLKFNDTQHIS